MNKKRTLKIRQDRPGGPEKRNVGGIRSFALSTGGIPSHVQSQSFQVISGLDQRSTSTAENPEHPDVDG